MICFWKPAAIVLFFVLNALTAKRSKTNSQEGGHQNPPPGVGPAFFLFMSVSSIINNYEFTSCTVVAAKVT
jgi:hypothetical protein